MWTKEKEKETDTIEKGNGNEAGINLDTVFPGKSTKEYHDFFSEQMALDPLYEVRLYRVPESKQEGIELLDVYSGKCPHERDMGYEYGSGLYRAHGRRPGQKDPDVRIIRLAKIWDARKREKDAENVGDYRVNNDINSNLAILERLADVMKKLGGGSSSMPEKSLSGAFKEIQTMQIDVVKTGIKERASLLAEFKKLALASTKEEPAPVLEQTAPETLWDHPVVNEIMDGILQYGKKWLGAPDGMKDKYKDTLTKNPAFQEIIKDENKILALYNKGSQHSGIGQKLMDELFQQIGIGVKNEEQPEEQPEEKAESKK